MSLNALLGTDESTATVDGTTYTLTPKSIEDYAEIDSFILSRRIDPLSLIGNIPSGLSSAERQRIIDAMIDRATRARMVMPIEIQEYFSSITGISHQLWLALKTNHPEINCLEKATHLVLKMGFEEAINAAAASRQEAEIKN